MCAHLCNHNSTKTACHSEIFIKVIQLKQSNFENKAISSPICK